METMIFVLQVIISILFFAQKIFILIDKKSGWLIGALSALIGTVYFYSVNMYCFTALECGLTVLMIYGYFTKQDKNLTVEKIINIVTALLISALAYWAFTGVMTIAEFISSLSSVAGVYLLTHRKLRSGWLFLGVSHVLAAIVGYNANQWFFADFQLASTIVALAGWWQAKK
ncbi:MAG: hypothetical protein V1765_00190 [bacterium]